MRIAAFICFTTKAIHLESLRDYTTETFLDVSRRFTSRRGTPHTVWSANSPTFKGANRTLKVLEYQIDLHFPNIIHQLCNEVIS